MLEKIIYKNHMNEVINFGQSGIFANSNDLRNFSWSYTSKNNRISEFKRGIVTKTIPVIIQCDSEEEGIKVKNRLFECAEKDVLTMQYGRIIIGDYYLQCYVTDYTTNLLGKSLNNTDFIETNFRMVIYGACENPEVIIAGHKYQVNVSIAENEYLTIDSVEKTIVLTHTDGTRENCFNSRNRDSYIFEKIPSGVSGVSSGHFKFDVTLLEERSEPRWT